MGRAKVEVRDDGCMLPGSQEAARELIRRSGTYELLPSHRGALVLRRLGVEATTDFWVSGEITRLGGLWGLLGVAAHTGWRGELVVAATDGPRRSLFLDHGSVISAHSDAPQERLGAVLEHSGALSAEQVSQVLGASSEEQRFGEAAVALGLISGEQLYERIGDQVREIFHAVLQVDDGSFQFTDGFEEAALPYRVHVEIDSLLMEAMSRLDQQADQGGGQAFGALAQDLDDVVATFNQAMALVHLRLAAHGLHQNLSGQVTQFAEGNPVLTALEPARRQDGALLPEQVELCANEHDLGIEELSRTLHDCATFVVFLAESLLRDADPVTGASDAAELSREVAELTMSLAPEA